MKPALHQNPTATQFQSFLYLFKDLLKAQHVSLAGTGFAEESAEGAHSGTDVAVIDVAVNDVGYDVIRMQLLAQIICQALQNVQRRVPGDLQILDRGKVFPRFHSS